MRLDGRSHHALRPFNIELGFTRYAEGSALITQGSTVVLSNAALEEEMLPAWLEQPGTPRDRVTAEYTMLPHIPHTRNPRETTPRGRTQEISRLLGRSLRAAVNLSLLGRRQIIVVCDVIQPDGGPRPAAITGGYLALAIALRQLVAADKAPASNRSVADFADPVTLY